MNENYRLTNVLYSSQLTDKEQESVKVVAIDIFNLLKNTTLTHYQAEQALKCAKVILSNQTI